MCMVSVLEALKAGSDMTMLEQCRIFHGHASVSILGALRASSDMTMLEQCRVLHELASVIGFVVVGSGLIDEYGKCRVVGNSRRVFDELEMEIDVIGWNTMMVGYVRIRMWFRRTMVAYKLELCLEQYTCLVGALGNVRRIE
ncbi:hypothetical protein CQW23_09301 [Capsicum baccatum]|uniref:Uncharacterized protein n=1 Tax=Capsicum baccatum TaxID=33114 RepID=A0A2G2WWD5_CAPBA|nr:hypothetical protein CQW23_09301 [Capsicum baccatum]